MAHTPDDKKREETFVVKLHKEDRDALVRLAEANFRRPGDQLRFMIAKAFAETFS